MAKEKAPTGVATSKEGVDAFLTLGPRTAKGYEVLSVALVGGKLEKTLVAGPYPLAAAAERLRMEVVTAARRAK